MISYLNFLDTTLRFDVAPEAGPAFAGVHRFFRHHLSDRPRGAVTFRIDVLPYRPDRDVAREVWDTEQSVIRRSTAAAFNLDAHVVERGGRRLYVNRATLLDTPLDAAADNRFELRITGASTVQVLDFVRDLVIRREESLGTVVLHASGVHDGEVAVAIAGPKGAGKTTALLSALRRPRWRYLTGDKLFCRIAGDGGHIEVHPWRDYPYVGVGTILADPRLTELVRGTADPDVHRRPPSDKVLIDVDAFESWLGSEFSPAPRRLAAVLLPEVRPGEPLRARPLTDPNERLAQLNKIVDRQADTTFFTWQSYLVPDYAAFFASLSRLRGRLASVPMVRLRGTLDVDPDAVLAASQPPSAGPQPKLRLSIIGLTGSGKSTLAGIVAELARRRGLTHATVKLAEPLYDLQEQVYLAAGVPLPAGAQDQQLMEALAAALRRIRPDALAAGFLARLAGTDADVIVNDDLRDPHVDAAALRARGFRIVRVTADPAVRAARLAARGDLTTAERSTSELDLIEPDAVIDNSAGLDEYRDAAIRLLGGWL